jgi:alpha-D-xyloside xylohydrolase
MLPKSVLPKSAYGYLQSKQRYQTQAELMGVAKGYRDRKLPIDDLVINWSTYTKMGQMDIDPKAWPHPAGMLKQLHAMRYHVMISVWPRFTPGSRYYDMLQKNRWFEHLADGTPDQLLIRTTLLIGKATGDLLRFVKRFPNRHVRIGQMPPKVR